MRLKFLEFQGRVRCLYILLIVLDVGENYRCFCCRIEARKVKRVKEIRNFSLDVQCLFLKIPSNSPQRTRVILRDYLFHPCFGKDQSFDSFSTILQKPFFNKGISVFAEDNTLI